ncbi:MAG: AAA family ATPase [Deltaproteobacteria bacterium]|jgi:hypothetical protein|nr:AAA family ATPase [Deltaproteobacteria bacterium]
MTALHLYDRCLIDIAKAVGPAPGTSKAKAVFPGLKAGTAAILSAAPGADKSAFVARLSTALSGGHDGPGILGVPNLDLTPQKTRLVVLGDSEVAIRNRLEIASAALGTNGRATLAKNLAVTHRRGSDLGPPEIRRDRQTPGLGLLIIDRLNLASGHNMFCYSKTIKTMDLLESIAGDIGCAILFTAHSMTDEPLAAHWKSKLLADNVRWLARLEPEFGAGSRHDGESRRNGSSYRLSRFREIEAAFGKPAESYRLRQNQDGTFAFSGQIRISG